LDLGNPKGPNTAKERIPFGLVGNNPNGQRGASKGKAQVPQKAEREMNVKPLRNS